MMIVHPRMYYVWIWYERLVRRAGDRAHVLPSYCEANPTAERAWAWCKRVGVARYEAERAAFPACGAGEG